MVATRSVVSGITSELTEVVVKSQQKRCSNKKRRSRKKQKNKFMSAAWTRKEGQNPKGGLNAKGRASYNKETGGHLKDPVKSGVNPRRVSFAARFAGMKGAMKKPNGEPTRKALALKAWGFGSVEAARKFANAHKKS